MVVFNKYINFDMHLLALSRQPGFLLTKFSIALLVIYFQIRSTLMRYIMHLTSISQKGPNIFLFSNRNPRHWTVMAGVHNINKTSVHQQNRTIEKVLMHESYDTDLVDFDITLLKLNKPLVFNDYVSPVCLPRTLVPDNTSCIVSGWGDTKRKCLVQHLCGSSFSFGLLNNADIKLMIA